MNERLLGEADGIRTLLACSPGKPNQVRRELAHVSASAARRLEMAGDYARQLPPSLVLQVLHEERQGDGNLIACTYSAQGYRTLGDVIDVAEIDRCIATLEACATALDRLHCAGWIHASLRPELLYVDLDGSVRLLMTEQTLKLARHGSAVPVFDPERDLRYMSPELTGRMSTRLEESCDVYSLGVIFYEILTGRLPFEAHDPLEWIYCHVAGTVRPPQQLAPDLPEQLCQIVLKMLSKSVGERYQTARGVAADLALLRTLLASQAPVSFELACHDNAGRILAPRHLHGHAIKFQQLEQALANVAKGSGGGCAIVRGYAGSGKTSLAYQLRSRTTAYRGSFATGKFEQFKRDIPFAALGSLYEQLCREALSLGGAQLVHLKDRLSQMLGTNAALIRDLVPSLSLLLGPFPPPSDLPSMEAGNRRHNALTAFLRCFAAPGQPLVVFLDDMQWADAASMKFLRQALLGNDLRDVLVIIAYRSNAIDANHSLHSVMEEMRITGVALTEIELGPLSIEDVATLVADMLRTKELPPQEVTALLSSKTGGNPFFLQQFLNAAADTGLCTFDPVTESWRWDVPGVLARHFTDNVVDFMVGQLRQLPPPTQALLSLAACLGTEFSIDMLALAAEIETDNIVAWLDQPVKQGLLLELPSGYRFVHDRVLQAAYILTAPALRMQTHLRIARRMRSTGLAEGNDLFFVCNQLLQALPLLTDDQECWECSQLLGLACLRARCSSAHAAASNYLEHALALSADRWWRDLPSRALQLYVGGSESLYLQGKHLQGDALVRAALGRPQSVCDAAKLHEKYIQALIMRNSLSDAIGVGLPVLSSLGIVINEADALSDGIIAARYSEVKALINQYGGVQALLALPKMTDETVQVAMQILSAITPAAYITRPRLLELVILKQVELCLCHGRTPATSFSIAFYATLLASRRSEIDEAIRCGDVALAMASQPESVDYQSRVMCMAKGLLLHYGRPFGEASAALADGVELGFESGDFNFAGYNAMHYVTTRLFLGEPLEKVADAFALYLQRVQAKGLQFPAIYIGIWGQFIQRMRFGGTEPSLIAATLFNSPTVVELEAQENRMALFAFHACALMQCVWFDDGAGALEAAVRAERYWESMTGLLVQPQFVFYATLARLVYAKDAASLTCPAVLRGLEQYTSWASHMPANFEHKHILLRAEEARLMGGNRQAEIFYDAAITAAESQGHVHEVALACERMARLLLSDGRRYAAEGYLERAAQALQQWGAVAKLRQFNSSYKRITANQTECIQVAGLDALTALKASQAISTQIVLAQLLPTMMQVVTESALAHRGLLMLNDSTGWKLVACAQAEQGGIRVVFDVDSIPAGRPEIINYVQNTGRSVCKGDPETDHLFDRSEHESPSLGSILCLPLAHQDKLLGLIYLEHPELEGLFTSAHRQMLHLLAVQIAISLENAHLYAEISSREKDLRRLNTTLELRVEERTAHLAQSNEELERALLSLKRAQRDLVRSERMAAIGNMVAGVAHELNTPIGNCVTSASTIHDLVGECLIEIAGERPRRTVLTAALESVLNGCAILQRNLVRTVELVQGFKQVAVDQAGNQRRRFQLSRTLEDILATLIPMYKHKPYRLELQIQSDVEMDSYPGALAQIITNLISNALLHGFEGRSQGTMQLHVEQVTEDAIELIFRDDGVGMAEISLRHLFEPFYTTKMGRGGVGLGMHIVYNLATNLLGGTIHAESSPGEGTVIYLNMPKEAPLRDGSGSEWLVETADNEKMGVKF